MVVLRVVLLVGIPGGITPSQVLLVWTAYKYGRLKAYVTLLAAHAKDKKSEEAREGPAAGELVLELEEGAGC